MAPRRPIALALADGGRWLFIANARSGSIAVLDTRSLAIVGEVPVGQRLADLALTPDGRRLVAVDEGASQLLVIDRVGSTLGTIRRLPLPGVPVSVALEADGTACWVASLWARQLTRVDVVRLAVAATVALPFAPRAQAMLPGGRLVAADAFGGGLALVDTHAACLESVRALPGHNVRGLVYDEGRQEVLVAHQTLQGLARATRDDIHWGNLSTSNLRVLSLDAVRNPRADLLSGERLQQLGDVTDGAADPAGVAVFEGGQAAVALAGVSEVALGPTTDGSWKRLPVGQLPVAIVRDGQRAYVANCFSDSVTVLDLRQPAVMREVALGERVPLSEAERGEVLFHDARLSHNGWLSCHSCHTEGHTCGLLADTLGDGSHGTPKRIPSLRGVGDTGPWAWNGQMASLEQQVRSSVETTMHGRPLPDSDVAALTAYLRTLAPPPPSADPAAQAGPARARGREVFRKQACAACHAPSAYTSAKVYDVGLADEAGNRAFNPPSLRGVGHGGPYFHDGRAATLEDVFVRHRHRLEKPLAEDELRDLLTFLRSL